MEASQMELETKRTQLLTTIETQTQEYKTCEAFTFPHCNAGSTCDRCELIDDMCKLSQDIKQNKDELALVEKLLLDNYKICFI